MKNSLLPRTSILPRLNDEDEFPGFHSLQREINKLFNYFTQSGEFWQPRMLESEQFGYMPKVDIQEKDKDIVITAELPGVTEKDIEVSLSNSHLILRGEKKEEKEEKGKGYYRMERAYGAFHRTIQLPCSVEKDKVDAVFKNGVVTITLPKTAEAVKDTKKIAVKSV